MDVDAVTDCDRIGKCRLYAVTDCDRIPKQTHTGSNPYAFTEQGVAMLSGVLNSDNAINMNITIIRAFIEIKRIVVQQMDFRTQLLEIKERLGEHDIQLSQIYDAMENLLDEKAANVTWNERERIGFGKGSI